MGIRKRVKTAVQNRIFTEELEQIKQVLSVADSVYREGKFQSANGELLQQLSESEAFADLAQRLQLDEYTLFNSEAYSYDRNRAVEYARYMTTTDQNVQSAVEMWTDFAIGKGVTVTSKQFTIVETTFNNPRNQELFAPEYIHETSVDALNEGELAFSFWYNPATVSKKGVSVRNVPTDQIEIIWLDKDDKTQPLWYKRSLSDGTAVYYPDWKATTEQLESKPPPKNAKRTDKISAFDKNSGTTLINDTQVENLTAVMSWSRMNRLAGGRGLPRFRTAFEWAQVLTDFMGDRAAVSKKAAMYTDNVTVSGGSRAIKDAVSTLQSSLTSASSSNSIYDKNPPPVAGSDWIQNDQVQREWQTRNTGSSDAHSDGEMLAGQLGLTTGIALHWAGFPGAIPGGLATARELLKPWIARIERYQLWLSGVYRTIALVSVNIGENLVLTNKDRLPISETDISVSLLSPILTDVEQLLSTMTALNTSIKDGTLDPVMGSLAQEITLVLVMTKLGVPDYEAKLEQLRNELGAELADGGEGDQAAVDTNTIELLGSITENYKTGAITKAQYVGFMVDTFGGNGRFTDGS